MGVAMFAWHTPALYELALRSSAWHQVEHACFFLTSLIFWWPVVQPWPSRARWPRWAMVPYLLIADLQNTALSAILVFSDRVLYPSYSDCASPVRILGPRRPGRRRSHHVGGWIAGVRRAGDRHRGSVPVEKIIARDECRSSLTRDISVRDVPVSLNRTSVLLTFREDTMERRTDGSILVSGLVCGCRCVFCRITECRIERR